MHRLTLLTLTLATALASLDASAQVRRGAGIGAWGELELITATGTFRELPGVETCAGDSSRIDGGSGWGVGVGGVLEMPDVAILGDVHVFASGRIGGSLSSIALDSRERVATVLDGRGQEADLIVRHDRTLVVTALELGLRGDVRFAPAARFGLLVGADAMVPLSARYDYVERIDAPVEAEFAGGGQARNAQAGDASVMPIVLGVRGGIFGEWPLGRLTWLRAELAGTRGLTSLLDGPSLTLGSLRLSLAITWAVDGDSTPIEAEE